MTFSDPIFQGPEPGSSSELPLRSFGFWAGRADRSKVGSKMCIPMVWRLSMFGQAEAAHFFKSFSQGQGLFDKRCQKGKVNVMYIGYIMAPFLKFINGIDERCV